MKTKKQTFPVLYLSGVLVFCFVAYAQTDSLLKVNGEECVSLKKELKSRRLRLPSEVLNRRLKRVHTLMKKKDSQKALNMLEKMQNRFKNQKASLVQIYRLKAQVYSVQENFPQALQAYQKAMELNTMSYREHLSVLYQTVTLYLYEGKLAEASGQMDEWLCLSSKIPASAYVLKAMILIQKRQKNKALPLIMEALKQSSSPREAWLFLAANLWVEKENYKKALPLLKKLVAFYPSRKKYWKLLSQVRLRLGKEKQSLVSFDLSHKLQFVEKEKEILNLTRLFFNQGQPLKAAQILEKAMEEKQVKTNEKHYELLGDFWFQAQEKQKAFQAFKKASRHARAGTIFVKIARHYMEEEQWQSAVLFFQQALEKDQLKDKEQVYIQMGTALFRLKKYARAIQSLEQIMAMEAEAKWIKQAREWINHIKAQSAA